MVSAKYYCVTIVLVILYIGVLGNANLTFYATITNVYLYFTC